MSRFIMTVDDSAKPDPATEEWSGDEDVGVPAKTKKTKKTKKSQKSQKSQEAANAKPNLVAEVLDPDFLFDEDDNDTGAGWSASWSSAYAEPDMEFYSDKNGPSNGIDSLIAKKKDQFVSDDDSDDSDDVDMATPQQLSKPESKRRRTESAQLASKSTQPTPSGDADADVGGDDGNDEAARIAAEERKKEYFSEIPAGSAADSFAAMNLSRPLLRSLVQMKFNSPSLVQQRAIPIALMGRDLCVCAATGSGKTAAFMLPTLERLLFRSKKVAQTRVLVLSPTRELALQCMKMAKQFGKATDIEFALAVGGMPLRAQEAELRARPDVVIATPGRLVDHITNTLSFTLDDVEILILDEADRLLDVGFKDELTSIITACPRARQTMLFSATMTDEVEDLVSLSLHEPVKLFVNKNTKVNTNLTQEFIRIRQNRENCREAMVLALCTRVYKSRCLIFVQSKVTAHRLRIIMGLAGLKAGELHGSLTQAQRVEALDQFTNDAIDFLVCTDLAGRGLDIPGVVAVVNMTMPHTLSQYIHRVGRTARAGKLGSSCTLVGENERKLLKELVKAGEGDLRSRIIPPNTIEKLRQKILKMKETIKIITNEEQVNKELEQVDMQMKKAENMEAHREEIASRPKREWIVSSKEKEAKSKLSLAAHQGGESKTSKGSIKAPAETLPKTVKPKIDPAVAAKIREIKRNKKPKKIYVFTPERDQSSSQGKKKKKKAIGFSSEIRHGVASKPGTGKRAGKPKPPGKNKGGGKGKGKR